ncbi:hypothetical protein J6590_075114 [Homalodisca vitripennis]|nr:hypothetical protein J6590_075114 [Homalodisca vitripennis]
MGTCKLTLHEARGVKMTAPITKLVATSKPLVCGPPPSRTSIPIMLCECTPTAAQFESGVCPVRSVVCLLRSLLGHAPQ